MTNSVKLIAGSMNGYTGHFIWTLELRYWRAIHAELMTHRAFSRNAGSSRAIPVARMLSQVWSDPAGPEYWGANQAGMQAGSELKGWKLKLARGLWKFAGRAACCFAWAAMKLGLHKQVANRLLEPWQYINVLVTATDWDNFFELRCHPDAQPEMQSLARNINTTISSARELGLYDILQPGEWHLPYVHMEERKLFPVSTLLKISTARSARVSYTPFNGVAEVEKEIERHDKLVASRPIHASPTEHQAKCMTTGRYANFNRFRQYRWNVEQSAKV